MTDQYRLLERQNKLKILGIPVTQMKAWDQLKVDRNELHMRQRLLTGQYKREANSQAKAKLQKDLATNKVLINRVNDKIQVMSNEFVDKELEYKLEQYLIAG